MFSLFCFQVLLLTIVECQNLLPNVSLISNLRSLVAMTIALVSLTFHICFCLSIDNRSGLCVNRYSSTLFTIAINIIIGYYIYITYIEYIFLFRNKLLFIMIGCIWVANWTRITLATFRLTFPVLFSFLLFNLFK